MILDGVSILYKTIDMTERLQKMKKFKKRLTKQEIDAIIYCG